MPKDISRVTVPVGTLIFEWEVKEYDEHERSRRWYYIMFGLGVLLIVQAIYTKNYLFAMILVLFGIILYIHEMQAPAEVYFAITETGVIVGRKFYRYSEFTNFWIIYNPPEVKNLYFRLGGVFRQRIQVPLLDFDPRPIREYLNKFLTEDVDQEDEPLSDRMARVFKIH